jgi:hypothetical protein
MQQQQQQPVLPFSPPRITPIHAHMSSSEVS